MPSGSVTRRIFFVSPSASISTAATTGWPVSTAPSLPVRQTRLALASWPWPFGHTLVHAEKLSFGCSPCACCGCCCCCCCCCCCAPLGGDAFCCFFVGDDGAGPFCVGAF